MAKLRLHIALLIFGVDLFVAGSALALEPRPPTSADRCPVCGMFVEKYQNWTSTIVFEDGSQVFFDGPKDMFRYLLNNKKYKRTDREISKIFVTDYYSMRLIDARKALFVSGSNVMGPMGHELIPLEKIKHAETFSLDHGGKGTFSFDEISLENVPK